MNNMSEEIKNQQRGLLKNRSSNLKVEEINLIIDLLMKVTDNLSTLYSGMGSYLGSAVIPTKSILENVKLRLTRLNDDPIKCLYCGKDIVLLVMPHGTRRYFHIGEGSCYTYELCDPNSSDFLRATPHPDSLK